MAPRMIAREQLNRRPFCPRRRIAIPFVTHVPEDGSPIKFAVEDRKRVVECAKKHLCQLCGLALDAVLVFMGGETATRLRLFRQAPFHEPCARYAVRACPYLRNTDDLQFATFCRRYEFLPAEFPLTSLNGKTTIMKAFAARAIIRVEPVGK
jgi:hypothetical protein